MKKLLFLISCYALFFVGCKDNSVESNTIFLGGQINNPESDYIVVSKENKTIDTLFLDEKNQFGKDFEGLEGGIYTFKHPPESQVMYMEPGDSVIIWLNTMSFDESLNFSGKGAEKSNFLLDMFLKNQRNNDLILTYYKIEPAEFARITDSIRNQRFESLEKLKKNRKFSDKFIKIAEASINYEYYDLRERYSFLIKKYYRNFSKNIPETFHDYRKEINFNNAKLQDYYLYTNLIDDYLKTKSIENCPRNHTNHGKCYNLNSFTNIERRILLIDSLSNIESLKNEFLDRLASQAIIMAEKESRIDSILSLLRKINYNNIESARHLANIQKNYFVGNSIRDIMAENTEGKVIKYGDIIKKPTITYAWSLYAPGHHKWQHNIIKELKEKYPELDFLGVNIDMGERGEWLKTLETFGYDKQDEYQIANREASKETYKKYLNKVLFVSRDARIVRGDIQFGSPEFEEDILEFLNK